ncbi:hypothetical protein ACVWXN_001523 [Bradyrhizobium sp. i1.4.4]
MERSTWLFSGKIHDRVGLVEIEQPAQAGAIADTLLFEGIPRMIRCSRKRSEIGGVGQLVDIDDPCTGISEQMTNDGGAYEARTAGHENSHSGKAHLSLSFRRPPSA